ncbi:MAG: HD domain-containing protein [Acidimicrobiales bacterium]
MAQPSVTGMGTALRMLPLKDMDPGLLSFAILRESAALGVDITALVAAMELAAYVHRDDARGNRKHLPADPYIAHPFRLVLRLVRYGCQDLDVLCAAALHDTVEDHPDDIVALLVRSPERAVGGADVRDGAVELLAATFGRGVARIVAAVTNPPRPADEPEQDRHQAYHAHVAEVVADPQVFMVKFADFVDNAGSLRHMTDSERRSRLARKYAPLVPAFRSALHRHRGTLPVPPDGQRQIDQHLAATADWLTSR